MRLLGKNWKIAVVTLPIILYTALILVGCADNLPDGVFSCQKEGHNTDCPSGWWCRRGEAAPQKLRCYKTSRYDAINVRDSAAGNTGGGGGGAKNGTSGDAGRDGQSGDSQPLDSARTNIDGCVTNPATPSCPLICTEVCDGKDNDCDGQTDEDDISLCKLANASSACSAGSCTVTRCADGFSNCDGSDKNGCEERLNTVNHCGDCTNDCSKLANIAVISCSEGVCSIGQCKKDYADCDGKIDTGCERPINTLTDCGQCNRACSGETCQNGFCCDKPGLGDCDGNRANGCETALNTEVNCGGCAQICALAHAFASCDTGTCQLVQCRSGYRDCDEDTSNGCEPVNTLTGCGDCGRVCELPHAWTSCQNGTCAFVECKSGWSDCNNNTADGCETDLTSLTNCGECHAICNKSGCAGGKCSARNCGAGFANCTGDGNTCETPLNLSDHCEMCGITCETLDHATATCWSGSCEVERCDTGYADCDGQAYNGCEVDLDSDINNCGACGEVCTLPNATSSCASGQCPSTGL